jgi:nucleoside-diphosphate-sugar epimerase
MRILVTGGGGFIGSDLVGNLCTLGYEVIVIDNFDETLYPAYLKKARIRKLQEKHKFEFLELDINSDLAFLAKADLDFVINLAALPGQGLSWSHLKLYTEANFLGVGNLLNSVVLSRKIPLIQISTSSVYGKIAIGNEDSPLKPFSPYGVTKRAAEDLIKSYDANFELNYTIFRLFSVFGPGQRPDMAVHKFLKHIDAGSELTVFGDGSQLRSMTTVSQVTEVILNRINLVKPLSGNSVFNIAGNNCLSVMDLIKMCETVVGKSAKLKFVSRPIGDQLETRGNTLHAEKELDFNPNSDVIAVIANQYDSMKLYGV